jgi:hypothetical protein
MSSETLAQATASDRNGEELQGQLQEFLTLASQQEERLDQLLACPDPLLLGCLDTRTRKQAERAGVAWSADITDPEFRKNLRILHRLVAGAAGLSVRGRCAASQGSTLLAQNLVCRMPELRQRISLPESVPLTLEVLLGHRFVLEQVLIELGDAEYLRSRAAELYHEPPSTYATWPTMFPGLPPPLLDAKKRAEPEECEATRRMLARLLAAKEAEDLPIRARRELKRRALFLALPLVLLVSAAFGLAIERSAIGTIFLPAAAGATGAALGRLLKLRDELNRGSQIREFIPFFLAQLVVGATAGLLVSVVDGLPIIDLSGPSGVGALSFVAGFSEAAFLGLVTKIAESSGVTPMGPGGGSA